jgi:RNA polymerase sigma-70 factor (ECF subfamily)
MDADANRNVTPDEYPALVRAAAEGDQHAMERLLLRAQESAYRFSVMVCGRTNETEDVMQDALISTYRHAKSIREPEAFRAWLYRTVRNACLLNRRRKVGEPAHLVSIDAPTRDGEGRPAFERADDSPSGEVAVEARRRRDRVRRAIATLPPAQREVLVLRDLEGLSTREVARVVRVSEDNVKTRLHRARVALRAALEAH